jgi:hypothetical protein
MPMNPPRRSSSDETPTSEDGRRAVLTTRLHYRHKVAARAAWAVVGPLHRLIAPELMKRTTRRGAIPAIR